MPNVNDYGVASYQFLGTQRLTAQNTQLVLDQLRERSAAWSRATSEMLTLFAGRTTVAQERVLLPGSGTLQPLDALGVPYPVKPSGYFDVGFPIYGGGTASARDRVSKVLETVDDIFRDQEDAEARDADWNRRHLLASLFTNTTRTFADPLLGNLTVQPLAITSDGVIYVRQGGSASTAQHYLGQAAAIADATNPYTTIETLLGAYPSNAGRRIIVYIPSNQVTTTKNLAVFYPVADPDVALGSGSDRLVGSPAGVIGPGDMVLGKVGAVWVVEWKALPDDYLLAVVEGRPPLAMREYPDAALQGFFLETNSPDGARIERRYIRYAGYGVRNRIAAAVVRIGNATYAIPTGYTAPLAV
jgi:hypothetical protein